MVTPATSNNLHPPDGAATASGAETPTPDRLFEIATAFWQSAVLLGADEVGLFAELAAGPCDADTLARSLDLCADAAADVLDALVVIGLVAWSGGRYRNAPEASRYLDPAGPAYLGPWLAMARASTRELADLTSRLRSTCATETGCPSPADRMWADVAEILRGQRP